MFCILFLWQFHLVTSITWINRQSGGDSFDVACSTCHLYNAQCTKSTGWLFSSCCNECHCDVGYTVYQGSCHSDLSRSVLGCEWFIEGSQYFGMKTYTFYEHETSIGYIMRKNDWEQRRYTTCVLNSDSQYWNTNSWESLFTNGRKKDDFTISNSKDGAYLKFSGNSYNQPLYVGLLTNLKLSCTNPYQDPITSCLTIKVQGKRNYHKETTAKPTTSSSTTGSTTKSASSAEVTTATHKHTTLTPTNAPRTNTLTPASAPSTSQGFDLVKYLPIIAVAILMLVFCVILIYCHSKRKRRSGMTVQTRLIDGSICGYQSDSSSEFVQSHEFEIIHQPSYSDVEELRMGLVNCSPKIKPASKNVGGVSYINHYSDSDESTSSDTSGNNERVTTDNVFHLISDEGN